MSDNDSAMARELHAAFQQVAPDLGFSYQAWDEMPDLERRLAVRACWQAARRRDFLPAVLEEADLEQVKRVLARETVIRHMVAETGEPREIVAEMVDASASMDQEAVLDLTEGEPTTLRAALERFLARLDPDYGAPGSMSGDVVDGLSALLEFPFPGGDEPAPEPYRCEQAKANQVHYPHDHGPDGKPQCAGWTWAQAGTVDGIRPHLPRTREEDDLERRLAEESMKDFQLPPELKP